MTKQYISVERTLSPRPRSRRRRETQGGGNTVSLGQSEYTGWSKESDYAKESGHARESDHANESDYADTAGHATSADTALEANHAASATSSSYATEAGTASEAAHASSAANLDTNSTDWTKILRKDVADTAAEVITFAKGIISTMVSKFKAGLKIGANDEYGIDANGDATLRDINGRNTTTENLTVTKEAHFFKLVVDEMMSNKGAIIVSSANCVAEIVTESTDYYDVYFSKTDKNGRSVVNPWMLYDQALCLTFTGQAGAFSDNNVKNRYYWRVITGVTEDSNYPDYHHIRLSKHAGYYDGTTAPAAGDEIVQLGYRGSASGTEYRKSAVILSAYPTMDAGVTPPSLAFYKGINDFSLSTHRYTYSDGLSNEFIGNFRVLVNGSYQNLATLLVTMEGLISNVQATMLVGNMFGNLTSGWKYLPYGGASRSTTPFRGWFDTSSEYDAILSPNVTLTAGKTYCLSFYSEIDGFSVSLYAQNGTLIRNLSCSVVGGGDTFNNQERYYVTFQVQTTGTYYLSFYDSEGQTYLVGMPLMEAGTSPSPVIMYSSMIAQTANQIDLSIHSKLGEAGVNINGSTRAINLIAGKVNFLTRSGQTNPKISIDPETGCLHAVDGEFEGRLTASTYGYKVYFASSRTSLRFDDIPADADFYVWKNSTGEITVPYAGNSPGKKIRLINPVKRSQTGDLKLYARDSGNGSGAAFVLLDADQSQTSGAGYPIGYVSKMTLWSDPAISQWRILEMEHHQ